MDGFATTAITLRDGREILLRPLVDEDRAEHLALLERLSVGSRRFRFFVPIRRMERKEQDRYFHLDQRDRVAIAACFAGEVTIRAIGRYGRESASCAEVAFVVEDALHGQGIGSALLARLAEVARANGISCFTAWVLADNNEMLDLFRKTGWPMALTLLSGVDSVELELPPSTDSQLQGQVPA